MNNQIPDVQTPASYEVPPVARGGQYQVPASQAPPPKRFTFGLTYWRQIEFFNVGSSPRSWFISLLDRLAALGKERLEDIRTNRAGPKARALRFHPLDWTARGIPISQGDFATEEWLGRDFFQDNDFCQFQVSTGKGRIIGFFDETDIFQIVLLDIDHNAQPSKKQNYQVVGNRAGDSEYNNLLRALTRQHVKCKNRQCGIISEISKLLDINTESVKGKMALVLYLEENCCQKIINHADQDDGLDLETLITLALEKLS